MDNFTQSVVPVNMIPSPLHGVLYFTIGVLAVCGNVVNFLVVPKISNFPDSAKAFIKVLSGCDLLVGITILGNAPSTVANRWLFGDTMCIIFALLLNFSASAGSTVLLLMSMDRLYAVSKPFHHIRHVTERKVYMVCGVVIFMWLVVAFLYASDDSFLDNTEFSWVYRKCFHNLFGLEQVYAIVILSIFFGQCFLLVIIYVKLWLITLGIHSHRVANQPTSYTDGSDSVQQNTKMPTSNESQGVSTAVQEPASGTDNKAIRTTLLVTSAFLGSWIPYSTAGVLVLMGVPVPAEIHAICSLAVVCNSWWNTVVYSICNQNFREKLKRIFKR